MADLVTYIKEVAMQPVREIPTEQLLQIKDMSEIRPLEFRDFEQGAQRVAPSVSKHTLEELDRWRKEKGQLV